jgi:hypothetical protein
MPTTQKSSSDKTYEEPSSLPDETRAVGVSTTGIPAVVTTATTEKGGTGAVIIMTISEASNLATTITR